MFFCIFKKGLDFSNPKSTLRGLWVPTDVSTDPEQCQNYDGSDRFCRFHILLISIDWAKTAKRKRRVKEEAVAGASVAQSKSIFYLSKKYHESDYAAQEKFNSNSKNRSVHHKTGNKRTDKSGCNLDCPEQR